jgi:hypothetical protein
MGGWPDPKKKCLILSQSDTQEAQNGINTKEQLPSGRTCATVNATLIEWFA